MSNIYELRRYGRFAFLISAAAVVACFFYFSNQLVSELAVQERERMQIWADATKEIVSNPDADIDFLLRIIEGNTTIPVLLTDDQGNILRHRNFRLPSPQTLTPDGFYTDPPEAGTEALEEALGVTTEADDQVVQISDRFLFDFDSAELRPTAAFDGLD